MTIRWIDVPESLANDLADLPALVRQGRATIIKDRPARTIFRVHLSGLDLHVKQCKVHGWRAWLRERLRPPKAHLEYTKLLAATARQVPTVQPIGCGIAESESFLITPTVTDAVALTEFLEQPHTARSRFALAEALGRFIARIHDAGILHPDPHPGNILVRQSAELELFLLDLHDARLGPPASERASLANLVLFNRWFILRTDRSDRLRFWRAYVVERMRVDYFQARSVEQRTSQSNLRFWCSRAMRSVGDNRRFRRIRLGNIAGFAVRDWNADEVSALLREPDSLFAGGKLLKDSRSSTVAVRELIMNGSKRRVICKRFRCTCTTDAIAGLLRSTACRRSWINGHAFLDCLLPTPRPLAMVHRQRLGLPRDGYLITEFLPNALTLREAVVDSTRRRERVDLVARLVRDLHQRGWSHRDLKAANVLLASGTDDRESAWLIDLAGASRPIRLSRTRRAKDLTRLNASFHDLPHLTRTDRLRFLRAYLCWNLHGSGDWKAWWRCIDRRTRGKVAKNKKRGRPLA